MDQPLETEPVDYDPASMSTSSLSSAKVIWYKRPWMLVTFAIVVVVGVSVVTDLPQRLTPAQDAADQNAVLRTINGDIDKCTFAVKEAFSFYTMTVNGQMTPAHLAQASKLLIEDQTACSYAGSYLTDLANNTQVRNTTAGRKIDQLKIVIQQWIQSDANGAIYDIQYLVKHPSDAAKLRDLARRETYLSEDRVKALNLVDAASATLGINLVPLRLPELGRLAGT